MKKVIIAAAVIFASGILSLYVNENIVHPTSATIKHNFYDYKKELASGD
jgi:hypothetical protein